MVDNAHWARHLRLLVQLGATLLRRNGKKQNPHHSSLLLRRLQ
jgi:hypothetical protein